MTKTMLTICKTAIFVMAGLLLLAPLDAPFLGALTLACGLTIMITALASLGGAYKKPVYFFLGLSAVVVFYYRLPIAGLAPGVLSMLPLVAIIAVLQLFTIPIKVGRFDLFLRDCLLGNFRTGGTLHLFLSLVAHLLSALLGFGAVPLVYSVFRDGIKEAVDDYGRFLVTAVSRGFSLSTFWAPGAVSVMLVMQATGTTWLQIVVPALVMSLLGIATSALVEGKAAAFRDTAGRPGTSRGESRTAGRNTRKVAALILMIAAMAAIIAALEQARILTGATRVLTAGLIVATLWIICYSRHPALGQAWREYWGRTLDGVPGLAALFLSVGVFSEAVDRAGLMASLLSGLSGSAGTLGPFGLLLVPPLLILLSLTGVHPFVSLLLVGKILSPVFDMPNHEVLLAFALLLGGTLSYAVSPFAGTILTLSSLAGCSPYKAAFGWNGLFAALYLLEGLAVLLVLLVI